jgi:formiminotetrahydrofolate cyclodeaminase
VGGLLAATALEGGALNVQINLGSVKDDAFRVAQGEKVQAAEARGQAIRDKILAEVRGRLP